MVLVVQTNIPGKEVEDAVVGVRLRDWRVELGVWLPRSCRIVWNRVFWRKVGEDVVLGDEVAGAWVQGAGEKRAEDEVEEGVPAAGLDEDGVEDYLHEDVEHVDLCDIHGVNHHWAEGVEQDLECAEEGLSCDVVQEHSLQCRWKIDIQSVDTKGLVVREVVWPKACRVWNSDR